MDELHVKRQVLEGTFLRRKTQLEQCLALALLAADLRELEDTVIDRRNLFSNTDQFGKNPFQFLFYLYFIYKANIKHLYRNFKRNPFVKSFSTFDLSTFLKFLLLGHIPTLLLFKQNIFYND